jgi:predicted metal-dependent HD superfamily phosphohydrolase
MNKISEEIVRQARDYIAKLLDEKLSEKITFHTFAHAKYVAESAEIIGRESGLSKDELNLVVLSAWFHDIGYIINSKNHEVESVKIATSFLVSKGIDKREIEQVKNCIMATKIPQQPKDTVSQVLCDADLKHLSEESYFGPIDNMRKEWSMLSGKKIRKLKFHKLSAEFFRRHSYHTDYGKRVLQPKKEKNLQLLHKEIYMLEKNDEQKFLNKKLKKDKPKGYSRGVESMFRLTARNQISLSSIADNKSNILISVNAIIMSVSMTVLVSRFEEAPNIIIPTLVFLLFCLVTIVIAILSTRPNISSGTFSKEDIKQNKVNLLFFGNFYNMKLEDYEWAIGELMRNDNNLYSTMIKDQFSLGKVLAKKYKLLRVAYNIFMVGIIISVLAFVVAFLNI